MSTLLRPGDVADAASIAKVHIKTWQTAYRGQLPAAYLNELEQELPQRTAFWRTHIATPPEHTETWVAEETSRVVGFMALGPARNVEGKATGEVYAIYIHPRFWNQGVGRVLFARGIDRLVSQGFSNAILWVLESNARARRFYEAAGWIRNGATKTETLPGGIELREVCYRKKLDQ
jgi:GNAT superfamily N-acetyltransferase